MLHIPHVHLGLHFWHHYDKELRLIYFSMSLRIFAINLAAVFVPIYLYELGFSVRNIISFFVIHFLIRMMTDLAAGYFISRWGAKHSMSLGLLFLIFYISMLLFLGFNSQYWLLIIAAVFLALESSFFFVAYHINFSKVKQATKAGHQLSSMAILIALASAIAPLTGGGISSRFGLEVVLVAIAVLLVLAAIPLLRSQEIVQPRKLILNQVLNRKLLKGAMQFGALGLDHFISVSLWPLFIFLVAFSDNPYLAVGSVTTIALLITITTDYGVGRLIDHNRAASIKRASASLTAVFYFLRELATNFGRILAINLATLVASAGMVLARTSQFYQEADHQRRIEYVMLIEAFGNAFKAIFWLILLFASSWLSALDTIVFGFMLAAVWMAPLIIWSQIEKPVAIEPETTYTDQPAD